MTRRDTIIKAIGEKVSEQIFDFDNNEYELTGDEFCPTMLTISGRFDYKGCSVSWSFSHGYHNYIEVELYAQNDSHMLTCLEEAVNAYVCEHVDSQEVVSLAADHCRDNSMDEWESHGFRDAADYYQWRYGRSA